MREKKDATQVNEIKDSSERAEFENLSMIQKDGHKLLLEIVHDSYSGSAMYLFPTFEFIKSEDGNKFNVVVTTKENSKYEYGEFPNLKTALGFTKAVYKSKVEPNSPTNWRPHKLSVDTAGILTKWFCIAPVMLTIGDTFQSLSLRIEDYINNDISRDFTVELINNSIDLILSFKYYINEDKAYNFFKVDNRVIIYNSVSSFEFKFLLQQDKI